jgi:hypothetical protein
VRAVLPPSQPSPARGEGLVAGIEAVPGARVVRAVTLPPSQPSPARGEGLVAGIGAWSFPDRALIRPRDGIAGL